MTKEFPNLEVNDKNCSADNFIWGIPFLKIKDDMLGKGYVLSLNFVSKGLARDLNIKYREKDYYPNILTFPLDNSSG